MNIRYVYTMANGREGMLVGYEAIPPRGSMVTVYPSRPGQKNPVTPEITLEVTGAPEYRHIRTTFGQQLDVLVPCKRVSSED